MSVETAPAAGVGYGIRPRGRIPYPTPLTALTATNPALSASRRCGSWAATGVAPAATHKDRSVVLQAVDAHAEVPGTSKDARIISAWDSSSDSSTLESQAWTAR